MQIEQFYRQFIGPEDLVFDLGANLGVRSELFSKMCGTVVAVEPQNPCFEKLESKFRGSNVIPINKAVGAVAGISKIRMPSDQGGLGGVSSMSDEFIQKMGPDVFGLAHGWDTEQGVVVVTLDNLIALYGLPTFIKIDVEGYEFPVVSGLSQRVSALSFEFHPQLLNAVEEVVRRLRFLGMDRFNYCLAETFDFSLESWVSGAELCRCLEQYAGDPNIYGDVYAK